MSRPCPETTVTMHFSGNVRRLRLRPKDIVIVECETPISPPQASALYKDLDAAFPLNQVLILSQGLRISRVLRPDDTTSLVSPDLKGKDMNPLTLFKRLRKHLHHSRRLEGVDGVSVPSGAQLKAAGKHFVGRYLSTPGNPKNLTKAEAQDFHAHGLGIVLFFETTGTTFLGGFEAGKKDALSAIPQLRVLAPKLATKYLGAPAVYFTIDTDPTGHEKEIVAYIKGAASVLGHNRTGVYGGYGAIDACHKARACAHFCQAFAWSYGKWHHASQLQQYANGQTIAGHTVDLERRVKTPAGIWWH